jgi:probable DNA metabolism protein
MRQVALLSETDWTGWRAATRALVLAGVPPADVAWTVGGKSDRLPDATASFNIPRALVLLASVAIQAREKERFGLLYSLVWRAHGGMDQRDDPDMALARRLALDVRADAHRMRTHLRFMPAGEGFLGWYAPGHYVLEANALLIARRFPARPLTIATPDASAHWDGTALRFGAGLAHPEDDATLLAWWEAHGDAILADASEGTAIPEAEDLDEAPRPPNRPPLGAVVFPIPADPALTAARREAAGCQRCDLCDDATQTVFGEGPADAAIMFVGEQPGDQEDTIGRPFVGPAGQLLDRALEEAGIDRRAVYITNAVKHCKFTLKGKRRIHVSPSVEEIAACGIWLETERAGIRPKVLVLMGGSAARGVLGRPVAVTRERGRAMVLPDGQLAFVTVHPSYLLRVPEGAAQAREYLAFLRDLVAVRDLTATPT